MSLSPCQFFKFLSDDTRLQSILLIHRIGEACVCEIMAALDESQPKISRHLAQLRHSNILTDRRQGQWVFYAIHPDLPSWAREILDQTCKAEEARVVTLTNALNAM